MPSATLDTDSTVPQFRQRVPRDVAAKARGRIVLVDFPAFGTEPEVTVAAKVGSEVKFSLKTRDPAAARARTGLATAHLARVWATIRQGPAPLSQKQVIALAGDVYRHMVETFEGDPGNADSWSAIKAWGRAVYEGRVSAPPTLMPSIEHGTAAAVAREVFGFDLSTGIDALDRSEDSAWAMEMRYGMMASWMLSRRGLEVDADTRGRLLAAVHGAVTDACHQLKRNAGGDYTPDPRAARFPTFEAAKPAVTLPALLDRWAAETKPAGSTLMTTRGIVASLHRHVQGCGVAAITAEQVVAWKDALLASGDLTPRTVNDTYLAMMRALFNWGVANKLLKANPAQGVKVTIKAQAGTSMLPYSDDEVARLLAIARMEKRPAYRWLPWLAATTGARIGELAQAWGSNVETVDSVTVLHIRPAPDAGSLKTESSERTVPLHPALIAEGFLDFVRSKGDGPLFYKRSSGKEGVRHASKGVANHLGTWVREQPGFDDARKAPNHALRHWWKSAAFKAGVPDSVADFLQGHRSPSVAARYRHFDTATLAAAVTRVPIPATAPVPRQSAA